VHRPRHWIVAAGLLIAGSLGVDLRAERGPKLFTGDAEFTAPGRWEAVVGVGRARGQGAGSLAAPEVELAYGLSSKWQLEAELGLESLRPAGGSRTREFEGSFGAKWLMHADRAIGFAVALFPQMQFDSSPGLSLPGGVLVEDVGCRLPVLLEKTLGPVKLGAELGHTWHTKRADQWTAGLALEHEFGDDFELGAEVYSLWSPDFSRRQVAVGLGAAIELGPKWQLLATIGRDLRNDFGPKAAVRGFLGVRWSP
jgi:hypothetical protein